MQGLLNSARVYGGAASRDHTIDDSHVGESLTPRSDLATVSGTTKDVARSLLDMRTSPVDHQTQTMDPKGCAGDVGEGAAGLEDLDFNVENFAAVSRNIDFAPAGEEDPGVVRDREGTDRDAADSEGIPPLEEQETEGGVADSQHAPTIPPSGDIPMIAGTTPDPSHHPPLTEECSPQSSQSLAPTVIPSSPPPPLPSSPPPPLPRSTFPEETHQSPPVAPDMNEDVVDDTLKDLDAFSPETKRCDAEALVCDDVKACDDVKDKDAGEEEKDLDLYEGLPDNALTEVSTERDLVVGEKSKGADRECGSVVLQKGLKHLQQSLPPDLPLGTTSAPPATRGKGKTGPSTGTGVKGKGKGTGTEREAKGKSTLAGILASLDEQVRQHVSQRGNYTPPSRNAKYIEAVREAHEFVYKDYNDTIPFTNNFEKKPLPDADV